MNSVTLDIKILPGGALVAIDNTKKPAAGDYFYKTDTNTIERAEYEPAPAVSMFIVAANPKIKNIPMLRVPHETEDISEKARIALDSEATDGITTNREAIMFTQGYLQGHSAGSKKKFTIDDIAEAVKKGVSIAMQNTWPGHSAGLVNFDTKKMVTESVAYVKTLENIPKAIEVWIEPRGIKTDKDGFVFGRYIY